MLDHANVKGNNLQVIEATKEKDVDGMQSSRGATNNAMINKDGDGGDLIEDVMVGGAKGLERAIKVLHLMESNRFSPLII